MHLVPHSAWQTASLEGHAGPVAAKDSHSHLCYVRCQRMPQRCCLGTVCWLLTIALHAGMQGCSHFLE